MKLEDASLLKPIFLTVTLCPELAKITGWRKDRSIASNGCPFLFILESLLVDYPKIMERYPPDAGLLGFTVNGFPPAVDCLLRDGDHINFRIYPRNGLH